MAKQRFEYIWVHLMPTSQQGRRCWAIPLLPSAGTTPTVLLPVTEVGRARTTFGIAIVHPVDKLQGSDDAVRTQVWEETTHLLTPMLGKLYARFEPAQKAWRQATYTPLGVVLGRTDPALFLYFFSYGKTMQKEAMEFHLSGLMNSLAVDQKVDNGNIHSLVMSSRENSEEAAVAHAAWHVGMTCGEIFPDSGIYFAAVKQATISDKLTEDIAKNMEQYAISLVRLYAEGAEDK